MAKRGNGEGSIFKDKKRDRWIGQYTINTTTGKKRKSIYGSTRSEVRDRLNTILSEISTDIIVNDEKVTLKEWIILWLENYKKLSLKRSSMDHYYRYFNYHIKESNLANISIKKLTALQIQQYLNEKYKNGRVDGKGGLSSGSVKHIYNIINGALDQAVKNQMIKINPCLAVTLPSPNKKEALYFTPEQAKEFLNLVKDDKYYPLYCLELETGLRLGEIIALRWENVDLKTGRIDVNLNASIVSKEQQKEGDTKTEIILQTPKTKKSIRTLYIDEDMIFLLKKLKKQQKEYSLQFSDVYKFSGFVFTNDEGNIIHPRSIQDHFKRVIKRGNFPNLHFHSLRHTVASIMLYNGEEVKIIQEILGHSDVQTTLDIYAHVMEDKKKEAQQSLRKSIFLKENMEYVA